MPLDFHIALTARGVIWTRDPFHHGFMEISVSFGEASGSRASSVCGKDGVDTTGSSADLEDKYVLHILLTHLTPHDARARARESGFLARRCAELSDTPTLLLGDLNTLSPLDDAHYDSEEVVDRVLDRDARLRKKFLEKPDGADSSSSTIAVATRGQARRAARIDYRPMQQLLSAGMLDLSSFAAGLHDGEDGGCGLRQRGFQATVGMTNVRDDKMHAAALRLDYILGNSAVCRYSHGPAYAVRDEETMDISDHLPVLLHLAER
jgi:endonuclease/exonuclease/phosphatase family metal-dependent hydrolase